MAQHKYVVTIYTVTSCLTRLSLQIKLCAAAINSVASFGAHIKTKYPPPTLKAHGVSQQEVHRANRLNTTLTSQWADSECVGTAETDIARWGPGCSSLQMWHITIEFPYCKCSFEINSGRERHFSFYVSSNGFRVSVQ